jgi:hypothetical protein
MEREPDPIPQENPAQPLRGPRWAHEVIRRSSRHERAERSGEPETALDDQPRRADSDEPADE